jgi:DNA-binding transcriptional LysR family regulator
MQWSDRIGRRIKLRDMHILLAVARSGSMGKAAAELAMSQPAVSKAVSDLEHTIGLRLLDRSPQGIEPTLYGEALLRCGTVVFDDLKQGVKELEFLSDPTVGELSIGCPEPLAAGFVAAVIDRFAGKYPKVQFNVVTADSVTLHRRELAQRNIEIALGYMFAPFPAQHTNVEILFDDRWVLMVAADSPWARKRRLTLAQLIGEPWVLPPPDSAVGGNIIADGFRAAGVEPPPATVFTFSLPLHRRLLATGRYLTALPGSMLHYGATSLRGLAVEFPVPPRAVAIMTLKNRTLSPLAERFIDCTRELAKPLAKA